MNIESIQLVFPDGGIVDEIGTMMVGANHLVDTENAKLACNKTLCGLSTARQETHCWSYWDPDPSDYDSHQEALLENVECDGCEEVLRTLL